MDIVFLHGCVTEKKSLFRNLGPYQLAWHLREHDYNCQVIDFSHLMTDEQLWSLLNKFITPETKILGWSFMGFIHTSLWWYNKVVFNILPRLKKQYPDLKIIVGGAGSHDTNRLQRNSKLIDYFFFGHAENTLLAMMNHLYRNGPRVPFEIVHGNKIIRENFADDLVKSKFDICTCRHRWHKNDCIQPAESLPIEISRGCIFKCKFCRYPYIGKTKNDFTRSMEEIAQEMEYNYSNWATKNYYILEDTFNDRNEKIDGFVKITEQLPFKIGYSAYLRPDLLWSNPGQAEKLERSGLLAGFLGVESFSPEASSLIGKPWSGKHGKKYILELWNNIWQKRVTFKSSMIIGIPPDTKDFIRETNQWFIDNGLPDWHWHTLNVQRDISGPWVSEFDRNAEKYGFEWMPYNGASVWKTEFMTWVEARDLKDELNEENKKHKFIDCWTILERGTSGYDPINDRYTRVQDLNFKEWFEKNQQFIDNYYKDLINL